jgi:hypothetical protein
MPNAFIHIVFVLSFRKLNMDQGSMIVWEKVKASESVFAILHKHNCFEFGGVQQRNRDNRTQYACKVLINSDQMAS